MLLRGIRARGDTKYQNFDSFLKIGKHLEKEKVNLSDLKSNLIFFRIESMFSKPYPKDTIQYSQYLPSSFSNYIHHSVFTFIISSSVFSVFTFIHY